MAVNRALLSVSDKTGLIEFARGLAAKGVALISTGGTAKALRDAGLPVTEVAEITGFPEMMEGRVKTLHPRVHAGILADREKPEHMAAIAEQGIAPIDLVVVNLYPFAQTISRPNVSIAEAVENIDIGGPSMVRAAAKNYRSVAVVVDPADYETVLREIETGNDVTRATKARLMAKAFAHTAAYDTLIAAHFGQLYDPDANLPQSLTLTFERAQTMRYGENPHQQAALYRTVGPGAQGIAGAEQLWGKELSYNNLLDSDAALELVREFNEPAVAIIKHTNPCGCAVGPDISTAFRMAREADPVSAFGGIAAANRPIDEAAAEAILEKGNFFEVIIAPGLSEGAVKLISERKGWGADVRVLQTGALQPQQGGFALRSIGGGLLYQSRDVAASTAVTVHAVTERQPTEEEMASLMVAWKVVKHVKSNAIVIARGGQVAGVGAGQMNRVQSVRLAVAQAGEKAQGATLASDAFFPFNDSVKMAAEAGVTAFIQPGGSKKDQDSIDLCNELGLAMVFTGQRHFRH